MAEKEWSDMAIELYDKLTGRGAEISYEFDNMVCTNREARLAAELKQRLVDWHGKTPWLGDPDCGPDRTQGRFARRSLKSRSPPTPEPRVKAVGCWLMTHRLTGTMGTLAFGHTYKHEWIKRHW